MADPLAATRLAVRALLRAPRFTIAAVLTLALGIGANTAIFSVADALLFRPPPFERPAELVSVWGSRTHAAGEYAGLLAHTHSYSALCTYSEWQMTVGDETSATRADGADVSANLFTTLGVQPALGHLFSPEASKPGGPPEVMLSDAIWRGEFGADPNIVGRQILFEGVKRTVVGVMPASFHFPAMGTALWIPSIFDASQPGNYWGWWKYSIVGRLAPGMTLEAAQREIATVAVAMRRDNTIWDPGSAYGRDAGVTALQAQLAGPGRTTMLVLLGVVLMLLALACANVANLVLVRAMAREQEFAVRVSLGSSRARLVAGVLVETALVALAGGAMAVGLARTLIALFAASLPPQLPRLAPITVDLRVLAFTFALTLLAAAASGLVPALRASRRAMDRTISGGGSRGASRGVAHGRIASSLTVMQFALAVVLVSGSGLLLRSLGALQQVDPGFARASVMTARVTLPNGTYRDPGKRTRFFDQLIATVAGEPGVTAIGAVDRPPLRGPVYGTALRVEGQYEDVTRALPDVPHAQSITPGYFAAMGIPLARGRAFTAADDSGAPRVVIVSAAVAKKFWLNEDPVGRRIGSPVASDPWMTIVGVANDVKQDSLSGRAEGTIYRPMAQSPQTDMTIVVRMSASPDGVADAIRRTAAALDASAPVSAVRTLDDVVAGSLARPRFTATLLAGFALVALVLAAVGIYGVISSLVAQRTREIGVRLALGATPNGVLALVLGRGARLAAIGAVCGTVLALLAGRALAGLLYGVSPHDAVALALAPAALMGVAIAATWIPARRAASSDPRAALRSE
ncbi:MAG TPA: ABC transporter permease [Gemmatimonadaceae bacterium]|nr:ABC transporter permease [Gemmatimonadaceae bacterium]